MSGILHYVTGKKTAVAAVRRAATAEGILSNLNIDSVGKNQLVVRLGVDDFGWIKRVFK